MKQHIENTFVMGFVLMVAFTFISCSTGISKHARSQVSYFDNFEKLQSDPQNAIGRIVMLGGKIIETKNVQDATELLVLQLPLNKSDRPQNTDQSQGRFLVESRTFLDPAIYTRGKRLTVVGKLSAMEKRLIDQLEYNHPKIEAMEIKLWPKHADASPKIRFGIGIGASF